MGKSLIIKGADFSNMLSFKASDLMGVLDNNTSVGYTYGKQGDGTVKKAADSTRSCSFAKIDDYLKIYSSMKVTAKEGYKFVLLACDAVCNDFVKGTDETISAYQWVTTDRTINFSDLISGNLSTIVLDFAKQDNTAVNDVNASTYIEIEFT